LCYLGARRYVSQKRQLRARANKCCSRFQRKSLIPTAIDLQLSKLSQLLVSSGIVPSIIDSIEFVASNERIDADIASAATAVVFSIERSLARQQVAELMNHGDSHREGGRLVHAIKTRLLVASARPLSQPDVQLLSRLLISPAQVLLDPVADYKQL
jgi:hypothetical protein